LRHSNFFAPPDLNNLQTFLHLLPPFERALRAEMTNRPDFLQRYSPQSSSCRSRLPFFLLFLLPRKSFGRMSPKPHQLIFRPSSSTNQRKHRHDDVISTTTINGLPPLSQVLFNLSRLKPPLLFRCPNRLSHFPPPLNPRQR